LEHLGDELVVKKRQQRVQHSGDVVRAGREELTVGAEVARKTRPPR
jgi:hypothetical protein